MGEGELVTQDERELRKAKIDRKEVKTKATGALRRHRQLLLALALAEDSIARATRRAAS